MSLELQFRMGISSTSHEIAVIPIPIYFVSPDIHISAIGLSGAHNPTSSSLIITVINYSSLISTR